MTKRTDIHRPSQINPSDYEFVGCEYTKIEFFGEVQVLRQHHERICEHKKETGAELSTHAHAGNCHICGAHCLYTCLFYHAKTNSYIRTGFDCAGNLEANDPKLFRSIKKGVKLAREAKAGRQKAQEALHEAGLDTAWEVYNASNGRSDDRDENLITDIVGKMVKYGSLSDKQINFLGSLCHRVNNRDKVAADRAREKAAAKDAPEGRQVVTVKILKYTEVNSAYGFQVKVFAKSVEDGFTVYGTLPTSLYKTERNDVVSFTATFKQADGDTKHAFFSRPTKGSVVEKASS